MESPDKNQGIFLQTFKKWAHSILRTYGIIQEDFVCIVICHTTKKNCINIDLANQLKLSESAIIDNNTILSDEKYELKNLQLYVDDYKVLTQFSNLHKAWRDSLNLWGTCWSLEFLSWVDLNFNYKLMNTLQWELLH